jgi:hypothetical protein
MVDVSPGYAKNVIEPICGWQTGAEHEQSTSNWDGVKFGDQVLASSSHWLTAIKGNVPELTRREIERERASEVKRCHVCVR